jgi:hypothetical protein
LRVAFKSSKAIRIIMVGPFPTAWAKIEGLSAGR